MTNHLSETAPLLATDRQDADELTPCESNPKVRGIVWGALTSLVLVALVLFVGFQEIFGDSFAGWLGVLPKDPMLAALAILDKAPVIDGHIGDIVLPCVVPRIRTAIIDIFPLLTDLPILTRNVFANNVSAIDLESKMPAHVDIPRLRKGKVGGFFWSVYVSCPNPVEAGRSFLGATWRVRDTLEQIDVARLLISKYPSTFSLALTSEDVKASIIDGKIASLLGVEGGHQLGNSIAVLRQYHALGVRYVTLTHSCHNAFADSCGILEEIEPYHGGLSSIGRSLIAEMNRLGVLVDLSHTSDATAKQALQVSKAPVIWSHSSARAVHDVPRNVPNDVLQLIGIGDGLSDAVVMVNFAPQFVADPGEATVEKVADHVEHIGNVAGRLHVGLGSDFDGIGSVPVGLEDVSKYPALIAELYRRGWNKYELAGLTGANFLRVFQGAEKVAKELRAAHTPPVFDLYNKRTDIPKPSLKSDGEL